MAQTHRKHKTFIQVRHNARRTNIGREFNEELAELSRAQGPRPKQIGTKAVKIDGKIHFVKVYEGRPAGDMTGDIGDAGFLGRRFNNRRITRLDNR